MRTLSHQIRSLALVHLSFRGMVIRPAGLDPQPRASSYDRSWTVRESNPPRDACRASSLARSLPSPSVPSMPTRGLEPTISALRTRRLRPLDDRGILPGLESNQQSPVSRTGHGSRYHNPAALQPQDSNLDLPRSERGVLPLDEVAADQAGFEPTACGFGGRRPSHAGLWSRNAHGTGGTRTHDLRVMSPASCQLLHGAAIDRKSVV